MTIRIRLNGELHEVPADTTVAGLIESLDLRSEQVAVEVNRSLVARDRRAGTALAEGDEVELVTLVGGG